MLSKNITWLTIIKLYKFISVFNKGWQSYFGCDSAIVIPYVAINHSSCTLPTHY